MVMKVSQFIIESLYVIITNKIIFVFFFFKSYIIEKFIIRSNKTKFSLLYSPQIICNCDKQCFFRNKDGTFKSTLTSNEKQIKNPSEVVVYDEAYFNRSTSIENIQHNISNYFKILYLYNSMNKTFIISTPHPQQLKMADSSRLPSESEFFTCNDFDSLSTIKPYTVLTVKDRAAKTLPDLNQLIIFLNECDRNNTIKMAKELENVELKRVLFASFKLFNKTLFNNFLSDLAVRWSKEKKYFVNLTLVILFLWLK